ncbi:hypothetical protein D1007_00142 [Hordeum vulgare]|nr:hypothetical protein D1007_00142 [Hordeum vulgare]
MATLSRLSYGLQFMRHTSRDWVNKKQKFTREESQDDVKKLLYFVEKMKKTNPEFFYDYNVDADNRVDKCIQTRKVVEHEKIVANELEVKTMTQFGFEV